MSEWDVLEQGRAPRAGLPRVSAIRVALLFGSAAVALALIATPMLDRNARVRVSDAGLASGLDMMSTGATRRPASNYVIRRSVLQPSPSAICVIHANGVRSGDC
ncbi:MAG TPA: hypothetical protein VGN97_13880 [Mesorhizobium sp.]|jgi:hypothetical protein|nr:hypothetical protein [Mesorhizobium sp.]